MKIVCFGDSNTWGYTPISGKRNPDRWTKVLSTMLDDIVIEEGLNSRTMYSFDKDKPWKRGIDYLRPMLESHEPIDVLVLMLGTNEFKNRYNNDENKIMAMLKDFINEIKNYKSSHYENNIRLIISGVPPVNDKIDYFPDYKNTTPKRNEFNKLAYRYALENNIEYIDNSDLEVGLDGIHLTTESHLKLALKIYSVIKGE